MDKKTTTSEKPTFFQSIDIATQWCKDWEQELLSDEVLADRITELVKTQNGLRGFFAYALSDIFADISSYSGLLSLWWLII